MKLILALLLTTLTASAALPPSQVDRYVDAIKRVENSPRYPYGIKSVKAKNASEARQVCRNTVVNNYRRWEAAGKPGEFVNFLADRYCPPSADPAGNANWKRNMKAILKGRP